MGVQRDGGLFHESRHENWTTTIRKPRFHVPHTIALKGRFTMSHLTATSVRRGHLRLVAPVRGRETRRSRANIKTIVMSFVWSTALATLLVFLLHRGRNDEFAAEHERPRAEVVSDSSKPAWQAAYANASGPDAGADTWAGLSR